MQLGIYKSSERESTYDSIIPRKLALVDIRDIRHGAGRVRTTGFCQYSTTYHSAQCYILLHVKSPPPLFSVEEATLPSLDSRHAIKPPQQPQNNNAFPRITLVLFFLSGR